MEEKKPLMSDQCPVTHSRSLINKIFLLYSIASFVFEIVVIVMTFMAVQHYVHCNRKLNVMGIALSIMLIMISLTRPFHLYYLALHKTKSRCHITFRHIIYDIVTHSIYSISAIVSYFYMARNNNCGSSI